MHYTSTILAYQNYDLKAVIQFFPFFLKSTTLGKFKTVTINDQVGITYCLIT